MYAADDTAPISSAEAKTLLAPLADLPVLVLAVSGGPDSMALLLLAARWRAALDTGPKLIAVTIDHGLRPQSIEEARAVGRLARRLGVTHRTMRWRASKPATGLQQAAREARYRLLGQAARSVKARHILTAHTLDDQAETVLMRMTRGSGLSGLGAMTPLSALPAATKSAVLLVRPLLDVPKARLLATLAQSRIGFADDASNRDPRFARARLRAMMPALAREGLDARTLGRLARRMQRADQAIDVAAEAAGSALSELPWPQTRRIVLDGVGFIRLPDEVALRLLGRAIVHAAGAPIALGKLEALHQALLCAPARGNGMPGRVRRTLAGALVTLTGERLVIERAPPRNVKRRLTKERSAGGTCRKPR